MSLLTLPKEYRPDFSNPRVKPLDQVEVDWSNPITRGLKTVTLLDHAFRDIVAKRSLTNSGVAYSARGGVFDSGQGDYLYDGVDHGQQNKNSCLIVAKHLDNTTNHYLFNARYNDDNSNLSMYIKGTTGELVVGARGTNRLSGTVDVSEGVDFVAAGVVDLDDNTTLGAVDGRIVIDTTSSGSGPRPATTPTFGRSTISLDGIMYFGAYWSRELSKAELISLTRDPYQILKPTQPVLYFVADEVGATYTLTCNSGSFAVTGSSVDMNASRQLAVNSGAFNITGTDVELTHQTVGSYELTCNPGSFALTGSNIDLTASRLLTANAGSYTITGVNTDLLPVFTLNVNPGSYAVAGSNVDFIKSSVLSAASGTFTLTGSNVTLTAAGDVWTVVSPASTTWEAQPTDSTPWTVQ